MSTNPPGRAPDPGAPRTGTLLDTLRVAVVMLDTSGRVLLWSPLAEEVLGWAGEHIVGRRVGGLFGPPEPGPTPPATHPAQGPSTETATHPAQTPSTETGARPDGEPSTRTGPPPGAPAGKPSTRTDPHPGEPREQPHTPPGAPAGKPSSHPDGAPHPQAAGKPSPHPGGTPPPKASGKPSPRPDGPPHPQAAGEPRSRQDGTPHPGGRPGGGGGRPPPAEEWPGPGQAERILGDLLRGGRWDGILSLRHRDGHTVQVEARASLLVDGDGRPFVLASMVETSRLRTLEHDLAALDSLFDSSPLGVAIFDSELRYVRVNDALARMNGLPAADHIGRTVAEVLDAETAETLTSLQRDVLATGRPVIDLVALAPGGRGHRSVSYHRLADRAGRVLGISATVMDVSERVQTATRAERARRRLALLNDVGSRIAGLLDVRRSAEELAASLVPAFSDYSGVVLHPQLAEGGELPTAPYGDRTRMRQMGAGAVDWNPDVVRMIRPGQSMAFDRKSTFGEVLATGRPRLLSTEEELRGITFPGDAKVAALIALGVRSLLVLPLRAHGVVLGLLVVSRAGGREPFDQEDVALAMELADRAGAALDNARLYVREREGALMLQRSLLPRSTPAAPGVDVAYRYVPGSSAAEVGGDWFDVIPLAGGRVAFVVGDVMGHGLGAAATMGRLRTAVRTLAGLDMAPDELLRRVNDLGDDLAQGHDEGWMATACYAVYDPSTRRCAIAQAGHLPPVFVEPGSEPGHCVATLLDLPSGVPLGVGGVRFETTEFDVPDGAVLVLYTDGLVESRGHDIGTGLERLRVTLCRPLESLEDACDDLLATMEPGREPDDVALLMARLGTLPSGSTVAWNFPAEASAVRLARRRVRDTLAEWELPELIDVTVLLVSELVTNSLRYAHGPIGVRMVRGGSLLLEVSDPLPDPPRERTVTEEDEGGRGLQLVAGASRRWGTRHGPLGKTVWFELALP